MRRRIALITALSLVSAALPGCMLSRAVDRAFLGISVRRPAYADRRTTGVFLLPFTFALDIATFPIQALLVVILGDGFPFKDNEAASEALASLDSPLLRHLSAEQQAVARAELEQLIRSGAVTPTTALALTEDGHWVLVVVDEEARGQLLARAAAAKAPIALAACTP